LVADIDQLSAGRGLDADEIGAQSRVRRPTLIMHLAA
jgi:hypothetical protein